MPQQLLITSGTLFTPGRQLGLEPLLILALMQVENGFVCIHVQSSLVSELRDINKIGGDYDVSDDLRIYQVGDEIVLPENAAQKLFEAVPDELLGFLLDVREARQKMTRPPFSSDFRVGNRIIRSEAELATLSPSHRRRNNARLDFYEARRAVINGLKRNWKKDKHDPSLQPISLWEKLGNKYSVKGWEDRLLISLSGSKLNLRWTANGTPPPLSVSSTQTGMFSSVAWQQRKGEFLALQYIPELVSSMLLTGNDSHAVLETIPPYEKYIAHGKSTALALFGASQAPPELFTLIPNHLCFHDEKKSRFPYGYLEHQAIVEAAKTLPSLLDKIGHLAAIVCCADLPAQVRWQLCLYVEKIMAEKPTFKPKDASIFWSVAERLQIWQEAGFKHQASWFTETAFKTWYKQMEQYRDYEYDLLIDEYSPEELEDEALDIAKKIYGKLWFAKAMEKVMQIASDFKQNCMEISRPAIATMEAPREDGKPKKSDSGILLPGIELQEKSQFNLKLKPINQQGFYSLIWFAETDASVIVDNQFFDQRTIEIQSLQTTQPYGSQLIVVIESSNPIAGLLCSKEQATEDQVFTAMIQVEEFVIQHSDEIQQIVYFPYEVVAD